MDQYNFINVDNLTTNRYESGNKQKNVNEQLPSLRLTNFRKEGNNDRDELTELIDLVATLTTLALPSDLSDSMQKRFLWQAVGRIEWGLHAKRGGSKTVSFHQYVENLLGSIETLERHHDEATKVRNHSNILY